VLGGKVWRKPLPLHPSEREPVTLADGPPQSPPAEEPVESGI
jgi:hypothetical protein